MFLIDSILFAPAKGLLFVFEKVHEQVKEELRDTPEKLKKELYNLQALLDVKQISASEYKKGEDNILTRWNALQEETRNQ